MYRNILLTVDLTEPASWKHALPQAVELARNAGAELRVIAVVPDFSMPIVGGQFPANFMAESLKAAETALEKLLAENVPADIKASPILRSGVVHQEVLEAIRSTGADLVVMASHAPDRVREFLVGSQADRVVRRSPVSVLVVRG